ncbi:hypothetical protein BH24GEM1_BH24GEM1_11000 [soil metagenome]
MRVVTLLPAATEPRIVHAAELLQDALQGRETRDMQRWRSDAGITPG